MSVFVVLGLRFDMYSSHYNIFSFRLIVFLRTYFINNVRELLVWNGLHSFETFFVQQYKGSPWVDTDFRFSL